MVHVFQPALGDAELDAVRRVFASNWVGEGAVTRAFEAAFAAHAAIAPSHVLSLNCCTEGLFLAMSLLELRSGDEVILPSISFVGAANAILSAGARPVFCDVDARTLNATAASIEQKLSPRTRAVLLLHYGGLPCEMDAIGALLADRRIPLVEDSACSVASTYRGRPCGTFGDIGLWSFDAMKILVTGDGGMLYCSSPQMAERASRLIHLGLASGSGFSDERRERWWDLEVLEPGRRAIMNDIAAAIGVEQLKKLPHFIARRRQIHESYDRALVDLEWARTPPAPPAYAESSYYFYWIQVDEGVRDRLATHLRDVSIYTTFRYVPLHQVPIYGACARLPHAEEAARTTLCLPLHQSLSDADVARVVESIHTFGDQL